MKSCNILAVCFVFTISAYAQASCFIPSEVPEAVYLKSACDVGVSLRQIKEEGNITFEDSVKICVDISEGSDIQVLSGLGIGTEAVEKYILASSISKTSQQNVRGVRLVDGLKSFCLKGLISDPEGSESLLPEKSFEGIARTDWFFGCRNPEGGKKNAEVEAVEKCRAEGYRDCRIDQEGYIKFKDQNHCKYSATAVGLGTF